MFLALEKLKNKPSSMHVDHSVARRTDERKTHSQVLLSEMPPTDII